MPLLHRIAVYPIKSFDGVEVACSAILPGGALTGDRRYALIDSEDRIVNGKRFPAIHRIRANYSDDLVHVTLGYEGNQTTFDIGAESKSLANWCGELLGVKCRLIENRAEGFPDDVESPGPTLISTATLAEIASWYNGLDLEETRHRFRANLEINSETPFWEDRLAGSPEETNFFRIGTSVWRGCNICQRCAVPSRNSSDGTAISGFASQFSKRRQQALPSWSPPERFDHFYRVAINTKLVSVDNGNILQRGDAVEFTEEDRFGN
jgi:uncharacterized protein YcbX